MKRAWLCAAMLIGAGCTSVRIEQGRPLTFDQAKRVSPGDSKAYVLARLGAPNAMFPVPGGSFFEYRFRASGTDQLDLSVLQASLSVAIEENRTDRIYVRFDREGRVTEIGFPVGVASGIR